MEINCTIKSILFQNPDNGYTILNVENEDTGKNDTVIATMMEPMLGMSIRASGDWVCNQKYGRQKVPYESRSAEKNAERMLQTPPDAKKSSSTNPATNGTHT